MKKISVVLCAIILCVSCVLLQGCSDTDDTNILDDIISNDLNASDLSIEDFTWKTEKSKYNGRDCYSFSLTNNSEYDIIAIEFTYEVNDTVDDSDLKVYDNFMNSHEGYIEKTDSPRDIILRVSEDTLIPKGGKLTNLRLTIGFKNWTWYDFPTTAQFELMEPKEMQLGIVSKDNLLYIAYYDFDSNTWILDENTKPVDTWSEKEIAKRITKPAEGHHIVISDDEDYFKFYSYGVTNDEYNQYVESIKKSGFKEDDKGSSYFEGTNTEGYTVSLWYYKDGERLNVTIEKTS